MKNLHPSFSDGSDVSLTENMLTILIYIFKHFKLNRPHKQRKRKKIGEQRSFFPFSVCVSSNTEQLMMLIQCPVRFHEFEQENFTI